MADAAAETLWEGDVVSDAPPRSGPSLTPMDVRVEVDGIGEQRLRPGELLAGTRYRIRSWLGEGGMGTVFEAVHEDLERSAALKILRKVGKEQHLALFRQEAKTLAKIGSRYVVEVYDFIELRSGQLAIAMELLRGKTLRDATSHEPLPIERFFPIVRQVCKGLADAHGVGIIHRDIKPENISLEVVEHREDAVKLLDFGIAQVAGQTSGKRSRAGTPGYLAPEVVSGFPVDARSDIYALGCMMYELVAGRRPFDHRDPERVLLAQVGAKPDAPSRYCDVPGALERVILKCLAKSPKDRYQDVDELEAAICEAQISLGVRTAWDDLPLPDVDPERRDRLLRGMPHPAESEPLVRSWIWAWLVGTVLLAAIFGALSWTMNASESSSAGQAHVDALERSAHAAAAQAFFVYPPPEDPEHPTGYSVVRELEALRGEFSVSASTAAEGLRREFADTLERLGDRYWDEDGGQAFALDYYAEALVFDPSRERAQQRAALTPGELRLLRSKAEGGEFTAAELSAAEPLIVLADVSEEHRDRRMERIAAEDTPAATVRTRRLAQLTGSTQANASEVGTHKTKRDGAALDEPAHGRLPALTEEGAVDPSALAEDPAPKSADADSLDVDPAQVSELDQDATAVDRAAASRLFDEGRRAHRRGDSNKAQKLFADALQADSRYAPAYQGLGEVSYDQGRHALAARMFRKAVHLAPRTAELRIALGDAYYKTFEYAKARDQYARAADLGSTAAAGRLAKVASKLD